MSDPRLSSAAAEERVPLKAAMAMAKNWILAKNCMFAICRLRLGMIEDVLSSEAEKNESEGCSKESMGRRHYIPSHLFLLASFMPSSRSNSQGDLDRDNRWQNAIHTYAALAWCPTKRQSLKNIRASNTTDSPELEKTTNSEHFTESSDMSDRCHIFETGSGQRDRSVRDAKNSDDRPQSVQRRSLYFKPVTSVQKITRFIDTVTNGAVREIIQARIYNNCDIPDMLSYKEPGELD
ncbi:uncharacterized protein STEHIDRAFT_107745 [Stereum hirsutum FP-91666 SS1]|uniref:uncharacterized protein n=1 Tax=Stereum hirsutum (strain FP-91666) TaxID=721885 RepID=UPI000441022C|nr:uncharacterized protein STEHIDRAFT_107745 [Stereum hirsutum FP-91666 SS1]EIM91122.1 hypothetical protein STEHIDRAFT_107745 [Stereum hirsutum FP-91666 SS1]